MQIVDEKKNRMRNVRQFIDERRSHAIDRRIVGRFEKGEELHIHVHAAVRLTNIAGEKLHPGIQDFNRWRATLAEEARQRHLPMEAVRRFDQAPAPAYKLKDVKMAERGNAPPNVRRRIERVQNHEIFSPTREEGWRRAQEAARQWRSVAADASRWTIPPPASGAMRLYRRDDGEKHAARSSRSTWRLRHPRGKPSAPRG